MMYCNDARLCRYVFLSITVKCQCNECQINEVFSKTQLFSISSQFTVHLYVNKFHFNEYHCNEIISFAYNNLPSMKKCDHYNEVYTKKILKQYSVRFFMFISFGF
jgi:hypothetical protein